AATDTAMVLSTLSSCLLEDVAVHAPPVRWFQLYLQPRRDDTQALLRRAEAAGYTAIVVTLDVPVQSPPRAAQRHGFALAEGVIAANLAMQQPPPRVQLEAGDSLVLQGAMAEAPGWEDLDWLLRNTTLPV